MGIVNKLRSLIPVSDRTEIQFHRMHTATPDGERQMITYITGEIVEQPIVVGSTADLEIPADTVLIGHDDKRKYTEINGRYYTIFEYSTHLPSQVPADMSAKPIPENLQGKVVSERELSLDEMDVIRDALP